MKPTLSIVIPTHGIPTRGDHLQRCLHSLDMQSYRDFEIVLMSTGLGMARNINAGIKQARGKLIKFLFMDDHLSHERALEIIVNNFKGGWLATGRKHMYFDENGVNSVATDPRLPSWHDKIHLGNNTIGCPSVITIENDKPLLFEDMTWLVDCEYYKRLHKRYGPPTLHNDYNVTIGIHADQETNRIPEHVKQKELEMMKTEYGG